MEQLQDVIAATGLTLSAKQGAPDNPDFKDSDGWTVTLKLGRRRFTLPYYMGHGHNGAEPTQADVLTSLILDSSGVWGENFGDWCANYGYDDDSRKAERIYKQCQRDATRLERLLGPDFTRFMESETL